MNREIAWLKPVALLLLLLFLGCVLAPSEMKAQSAPQFNAATGHWYESIPVAGGITWPAAKAAAEARSYQGLPGYLATAPGAEEHDWLVDHLPDALTGGFWIGAFQPNGETGTAGGWEWVTGEAWGFYWWANGQPDGIGADGAYFGASGRWSDSLHGTVRNGYVIEYGAGPHTIPQISFGDTRYPPIDYTTTGGQITTFDADQDGDLDLAVGTGDVTVIYGKGNGAFFHPPDIAEPPQALLFGVTPTQIAPADVNGDGQTDVVATSGDSVYVVRKLAPRLYHTMVGMPPPPPDRYAISTNAVGFAVADLNEDQLPDLIVTDSDRHQIAVMLDGPNGVYQFPVYYHTGSFPSRPCVGDWNGDGHVDVAVPNLTDGTISVFTGNGQGLLIPRPTVNTSGQFPTQVVTADMNGDGFLDLIAGNTFSNNIAVMIGNGNSSFRSAVTYPANVAPTYLEAADLDADGDPDIVVPSDGDDYYTILRNNGSGALGRACAAISSWLPNTATRSLTTGDFDRDGRLDLAITSARATEVRLNLTPFPPPAAPKSLTAIGVSSGQINLTWKDASANETIFKVERSGGGSPFAQIGTKPGVAGTGATVTFSDANGLQPSTTYTYRVKASGPTGDSNGSTTTTGTTLAPPPNAPSNLSATAFSGVEIRLSWQDNSTNEDQFQVERKSGSGSFAFLANVGANFTTYSDLSVVDETTYTYRVRAMRTSSPSGYSNEASATTSNAPAVAPSNLTAAGFSTTEIRLTWTDNSNNETQFKVERKEPGGSFSQIGTTGALASTGGTGNFSDASGLIADTVYTYRVRATSPGGDSGYSNEATASLLPLPPTAPTSLIVTATAFDHVDLEWQDNSGNETAFEIERKSGGGSFAAVGQVGANTTVYTDDTVQPQTAYTYRVRATNGGGASGYTNTVDATTPAAPTTPPSDLVAAAVTTSQIRLTWTDNSSNESQFKVERKTGGGNFSQIALKAQSPGTGALVTYQDASGLSPNTEYTYRVRAFGPLGDSAYSNEASATTSPAPPAAPADLAGVFTSTTTVRLTWSDKSSNETGFKIERKVGNGSFVFQGTAAAETTFFVDPGLSLDAVYTYRVRATGSAGESQPSNEVLLPTKPAAPSSLTATASSTSAVNLFWSDNSVAETGFKVERQDGASWVTAATAGQGATSVTVTGLQANTPYQFRVKATNVGGESNPSSEATGLTLPETPSDLAVAAIASDVLELSWTDNNPSPAAVKVERSTNGGNTFVPAGQSPEGATTFRDFGLNPSTTYLYRVRATNASGDSGYSDTATGSTLVAPPSSPLNFAAAAQTSRSIRLTWQDNSGNESGFQILRRLPGGSQFLLLTSVPANRIDFIDTGLQGSSTYSYRVRAVNSGGASTLSSIASATTLADLPGTPTFATATAVTDTQIQLTWGDTSDNETGFRIERKSGSGSFTALTTVAANTGLYVNNGLSESTTYTYRVVALNSAGESSPSNETSATTLPRPPSSLMAAALAGRVLLSWQDQSAGESGFRIERKTDGEFALLANVGAGATSYADTGVTAGTTYTYRVQATASGGGAAYSNEATATPIATTPLGKLTVSPTKLSFGSVKVNTAKAKAVKFTNKGKEPIQVLVGSLTAPYSVSQPGMTFTLAPKKSASVTVTYRPTTKSVTSNATLQVFSTVPSALATNVTITGKGK